MTKIIEVTFFSNELDILDLKLHEMNNTVYKHIIVEHPYDHMRRTKRLAYNENKERFKDFHHKIIHIIDGGNYDGQMGLDLMWNRNNSPLVYNALLQENSDDIFVLFTDSDVVMKGSVIKNIDFTKPTRFPINWYESYFNYKMGIAFGWIVGVPISYIKKYGLIKAVRYCRGDLGLIGDPTPEEFQKEITVVTDSGYHFSKCGDIDDLVEHIKGHPHIELAMSKVGTKEWLQNRRDTGKKWDDMTPDTVPIHPDAFKLIPYDSKDYPDYVNKNPLIYEKYFKGGMFQK